MELAILVFSSSLVHHCSTDCQCKKGKRMKSIYCYWLPRICIACTLSFCISAQAEQVVARNCSSSWVGWAQYIDYGDEIVMRIRPTKRAWGRIGDRGAVKKIWDAYFVCIPWDDGFDRMSKAKWQSLWDQHRCHMSFGIAGRIKSGDTFDYESWRGPRSSLGSWMLNKCN